MNAEEGGVQSLAASAVPHARVRIRRREQDVVDLDQHANAHRSKESHHVRHQLGRQLRRVLEPHAQCARLQPTPSPQEKRKDLLSREFFPVLMAMLALVLILVGAVVRERWKHLAQRQQVIGLLNQKRQPDPLDDLLKDIEGSEWSLPFEFIRIESKIGSGASGQVFKARMGPHLVAAKQLFSHLVAAEYDEIQHEAKLLSRLHHPALVRFMKNTTNAKDKTMVHDPG